MASVLISYLPTARRGSKKPNGITSIKFPATQLVRSQPVPLINVLILVKMSFSSYVTLIGPVSSIMLGRHC